MLSPDYEPGVEVRVLLDSFFEVNPKFRELAEMHGKLSGLSGEASWYAHRTADHQQSMWVFMDKEKSFPVQSWINAQDGKYATLIIACCNPFSNEIYSRRSAVIHYNYIYSGYKQKHGDGQLELYLPKIGYVSSYLIDYFIAKFKKSLEAKVQSAEIK